MVGGPPGKVGPFAGLMEIGKWAEWGEWVGQARGGSVRVVIGDQNISEFLEGSGLLVADGLGGDAPLLGDLGGGLALESGLDQGGFAGAEGGEDGFLEGALQVAGRTVGPVDQAASTVSSGWKVRSRWARFLTVSIARKKSGPSAVSRLRTSRIPNWPTSERSWSKRSRPNVWSNVV